MHKRPVSGTAEAAAFTDISAPPSSRRSKLGHERAHRAVVAAGKTEIRHEIADSRTNKGFERYPPATGAS
jgi:hypothetical protein